MKDEKIYKLLVNEVKRIKDDDLRLLISKCCAPDAQMSIDSLLQAKFFTDAKTHEQLVYDIIEVPDYKSVSQVPGADDSCGEHSDDSEYNNNAIAYFLDLPYY